MLVARRLIAEQCLYGVDINPLAVELAKLSIWLVTLAKGRPFGFLDHNLRCGDSLLGITNLDQLHYLNMNGGEGNTRRLFASKIDQAVEDAINLRSSLRRFPVRDIRDVEAMASLDDEARRKMELPELVADVLIADAFAARGGVLDTTALSIDVGIALDGDVDKIKALSQLAVKALRTDSPAGKKARQPLHWPLEFPEVFTAERGGFDAVVGNPPFLGDTRMRKALGASYRKYITNYISHNNKGKADLVVFFFLRSFGMLGRGGTLGLLATDTLSHGDSRRIGLQQIISMGGSIFHARTSVKWPGKASIVVHQVHIAKFKWCGDFVLNGQAVDQISSHLHSTDSWTPRRLISNLDLVFEGTAPNGEGFLIPAKQALSILNDNPRYADILYPYIIARQVNQNPDLSTDRWIINFWDWSEERSATFEIAYKHIEETVKPIRQRRDASGNFVLRSPIPQKWWQHKEKRPALYHAIGRGQLFEIHPRDWIEAKPLPQVLVMARGATKYPCFTLLENKFIFGDSLCIIANASFATFAVLSSDVHAIWAWHEGGRKKFDLRYTQESIFETFPFPGDVLEDKAPSLASLGKEFFELRQNYMRNGKKGMTDFYNDLHNRHLHTDQIDELRNLQIKINGGILAAYGYDDIDLQHGFHEVAYLPEGKNTRFTISERAREELLHRLAMLNKRRHEEETNHQSKDDSITTKSTMRSDDNIDDLFSGRNGQKDSRNHDSGDRARFGAKA